MKITDLPISKTYLQRSSIIDMKLNGAMKDVDELAEDAVTMLNALRAIAMDEDNRATEIAMEALENVKGGVRP